jgi:hypothetical protein
MPACTYCLNGEGLFLLLFASSQSALQQESISQFGAGLPIILLTVAFAELLIIPVKL